MKWLAIAGALAACSLWIANMPLDRVRLGQNDFLGQYAGARLTGTAGLHELTPNIAEQKRAAGVEMPSEVFMRPDYYAVLLKPLSALPYRAAYAIYTVLNAAALGVVLFLVRGRKAVLLLAASSIPLICSFMNGQDLPLLLAFLIGSVALSRRSRPMAGGLLLALCAIKPHLFVFVPIALIAGRRWRMIGGASMGVAAMVLLACTFQGWDWMGRYVQLLLQPDMHPMPFPLPNLRGLAFAFAGGNGGIEAVGCGLVVIALGWVAMKCRPDQFEHLLAVCLAAGLLVSHHLGVHDCALLLAVVALGDEESWLYKAAAIVSAPFTYFILLLPTPVSALPGVALLAGFVTAASKAPPRQLVEPIPALQ